MATPLATEDGAQILTEDGLYYLVLEGDEAVPTPRRPPAAFGVTARGGTYAPRDTSPAPPYAPPGRGDPTYG